MGLGGEGEGLGGGGDGLGLGGEGEGLGGGGEGLGAGGGGRGGGDGDGMLGQRTLLQLVASIGHSPAPGQHEVYSPAAGSGAQKEQGNRTPGAGQAMPGPPPANPAGHSTHCFVRVFQ